MTSRVLAILAAIAVAILVAVALPDVARYLKMRAM